MIEQRFKCAICNIDNEWCGQFLSFDMDHISADNRRSNLRMLCPNCHSQTPTFKGKKLGGKTKSRTIKHELTVTLLKEKYK